MRPLPCTLAFFLLVAIVSAGSAFGNQTYMSVTFDDKEIDAAIGTGGVEVGEPTWVDTQIEGYVRSLPFATPSLEVHDTEPGVPRNMGFELPFYGPVSGLVVIVMDVWFEPVGSGAGPWFDFYRNSWSYLTKIRFDSDGAIRIQDANGVAAEIPGFPKGRGIPILVALDLDTATYSVWVDETQVVADRAHGGAAPSFGRIVVNTGYDNDPDNRFWIDQIRVLDYMPSIATQPTTWGRVRGLYR